VTNTDSKFDGMKRFDARIAVLDALKEKGLYRETKENPMVVPICRFVLGGEEGYTQVLIECSLCKVWINY